MEKNQNIFARFFGVIISSKTYINLLYLVLTFPLGLIYFIFLIVGFSVGFALLVVLVGAAVLALVMAGWYGFANLERLLANQMLGETIPPLRQPETVSSKGLGGTILAYLSNPITWKSLFYLFLKFPLGVLTFAILVGMFVLTGFFSTAIITFNFFELRVELTRDLVWQIDTFWKALLCLPIGILLGIISLHICNWIARILGRFTSLMLSDDSEVEQIIGPSQQVLAPPDTTPRNSTDDLPPSSSPAEIIDEWSQETQVEEIIPEQDPIISWIDQTESSDDPDEVDKL